MDRLNKQIQFLVEIDKLKGIYRQSFVTDASRHENDAEHSWHLAMMAVILAEYALDSERDLLQALKLVLVHDLVEIDAGDTFAYDEAGQVDKRLREEAAAERIFSILPSEQAQEIWNLWQEFEEGETSAARFAHALDKLQPILQNYHTQGKSWRKHGVTSKQVQQRIAVIKESSPQLYQFACQLIEDAVQKKYLHR